MALPESAATIDELPIKLAGECTADRENRQLVPSGESRLMDVIGTRF